MRTFIAENGIRYTLAVRPASLGELALLAENIQPDVSLWTSKQRKRALSHLVDAPKPRRRDDYGEHHRRRP